MPPALSSIARAGLIGAMLACLSAPARAEDDFHYTVQPGDNAWHITDRYLRQRSHWYDLRRLNRLDGDHLTPGTVLRIPLAWLRLETPDVRLTTLTGAVMLRQGEGWTPARAGTTLSPGTWLRTPDNGSALLTLTDGTHVLVRPGSEVHLQPLDAARLARALSTLRSAAPPAALGVRIDLRRGGLENQVRPQTGTTRFEVRTPSAVTVVRGTEFRISTDGHTSRAEVAHGRVGFDNPLGSVELDTATGSIADPQRPPAAPVPLLPAPALQALPGRLSALRLRTLNLPAVPGARAYRVQWLDDRGDAPTLLADAEVAATTAGPPLPEPPAETGTFLLRVRAIDPDGLEGLGNERRIVLVPATSPVPHLPPDLARVPDARPLLHWSAPDGIGRYRIQISPQADFTTDTVEHETESSHWQPPRLPPGRHHWRVAGCEGCTGDAPHAPWLPWSEARTFDVPYDPPQLLDPTVGTRLQLRWVNAEPRASVQVQIAGDDTFGAIEFDEMHHFEGADLPLPPRPGRYHVRIRSLAANGGASDWSLPRTFDRGAAPPEDSRP